MPDLGATGANQRAPVALAFDTAASACSVAVGCGAEVLAHERQEMRHGHAEALLPMIDQVMKSAGCTPSDIGTIAVSIGPGGFTGIRAGLAAAHGLALATRARLAGVTSFAAVAAMLPKMPGALLVALDSRRDDFYLQLLESDGLPISEPAAVSPERIGKWVRDMTADAPSRLAGDAAERAAEALGTQPHIPMIAGSAPDALGVLAGAQCKHFTGAARPLYLRPPDVTFPKARR